MGTLVKFELGNTLGNKAGMVACALVPVMLVVIAVMNLATMDTRDLETGEHKMQSTKPTVGTFPYRPRLALTASTL